MIPEPLFGDPIAPWHKWFAWKPVMLWDGRVVWFRYVYRRLIQKHYWLDGGSDFWWQYSMEKE